MSFTITAQQEQNGRKAKPLTFTVTVLRSPFSANYSRYRVEHNDEIIGNQLSYPSELDCLLMLSKHKDKKAGVDRYTEPKLTARRR